jgi:hypothetical protein
MKTITILIALLAIGVGRPQCATAQHQTIATYAAVTPLTGQHRPTIPGLDDHTGFGFPSGWAFIKDTAGITATLTELQHAIARFEQRFGKHLHPGAVVYIERASMSGGSNILEVPPAADSALQAAGAAWVNALLDQKAYRVGIEEEIKRQNPGLPSGALQQTVDDMANASYPIMYHEIGHGWFHSAYQVSEDEMFKKNTPVPAWLEESAAISVEDRQTDSNRLQSVLDAMRADPHTRTIVPLDTLFVMRHPVEGDWKPGETVNGIPYDQINFYGECSAVTQFLLAHAGTRPILGSIADHIQQGKTMAQWLRTQGVQYGLPATIAELDAAWRQWLGTP